MFKKLLIANRGEIACRVIRTCRRMGIATVAVYSEADAEALHVSLADEAHCVGPAPAAESYLNSDRIIRAVRDSGAEAVHPGYGFLAENPSFAEAVAGAGAVFVGPPPEAMRKLGDKISARRLLKDLPVPVTPWRRIPADDAAQAQEAIEALGLPVVVKASAAGGGIGTTIVHSPKDLPHALETASGAAKRFFNSDTIHLERFVSNARHIEMQVLADEHGNVIHLLERECSMQRRYQKVVEEAPSTAVTESLRQSLAEAAITVIKAGGYVNAGTVEFLVDRDSNFYFLEVNSRIQVEHAITEMVTGVDIVEQQLRVANGERLALSQEDVSAEGHAFEARIYAEDPATFLPVPGTIKAYIEPSGDGVRVDSGVRRGYVVNTHYDPMLAKLIVHGSNRKEALGRMRVALDDFVIDGLVTNIPLLSNIFRHPGFISGSYDTGTLTREFGTEAVLARSGIGLSELWRYGN